MSSNLPYKEIKKYREYREEATFIIMSLHRRIKTSGQELSFNRVPDFGQTDPREKGGHNRN